MAGYLVFDVEITDQEAWQVYRETAGPVMAASGGTFLVQSAGIEPLEGGWMPASLSVVEFPSAEAARTFYRSPQYQALIPLREAAAISRGVLVTGA